jgi:phage-related protein
LHKNKIAMDAKPKFNVIYSEEVIDFLNSLPAKTKAKIMFNVGKARYNLDPKLFKKLVGTDIWEFRTLYNGVQYRLLAFWDNNTNTYVITTHGFVKKTQKTPQKEIDRAIAIRNEYYKK